MNKKRISIKDIEPEAYKAMYALEAYSKKSTLDPKLKELICDARILISSFSFGSSVLFLEYASSAYKAMYALEAYSKKSTLDPKLKELIKMRASQINGCAYCVDMHTEDALKIGESERRIFALAVWHESQLFTEEERALLQLTEEVTKISDKGVTDETYERAIEFFGPEMTAQIIMMIVAINGWNRIAVSTKQIYKP